MRVRSSAIKVSRNPKFDIVATEAREQSELELEVRKFYKSAYEDLTCDLKTLCVQ
jgi:hypothetical protein